jgi:hypothetical protein
MINPNMPNMPNVPTMPGMGAMTDTLEFMKNMWSSMGVPGMTIPGATSIPGMIMPSLSVEEIGKKITDLKAVESWLALNMTMLRSTIQALEVQAATISTLQTMGQSFTASMTPPAREAPSGANNASAVSPNGGGSDGHEKMHGAPEPTSKDESDAASLTAPLVNAAAWWNMLQDQFKQAVGSAMTGEPPAAAKPAAKSTAKPAAKSRSTPSSSTAGNASRKRKTSK